MKRVKGTVGVMLIIMYIFVNMCSEVYASSDNKRIIEINNLKEVYEKDSNENISKKIHEQIKHKTGKINPQLEEELNKQGVFDDEIFQVFSKEDLNEMKKNGLENINVCVEYQAVFEEKKEKKTIVLNDEQIDKYFGEKYYNEQNGLIEELEEEYENQNKKENFGKKLLQELE